MWLKPDYGKTFKVRPFHLKQRLHRSQPNLSLIFNPHLKDCFWGEEEVCICVLSTYSSSQWTWLLITKTVVAVVPNEEAGKCVPPGRWKTEIKVFHEVGTVDSTAEEATEDVTEAMI